MVVSRLSRLLFLAVTVIGFLAAPVARAQFHLVTADPDEVVAGPTHAKGVVVWSHGRSVNSEDSLSPTPPYIATLHQDGWDTYRFNRMRATDNLDDSARELVARVATLKQRGYKRIVLAGQSYGAFLSLMAADASDDVHAVIATAPAAYGSFADFYESWRSNATELYPLLESVRHARVMLFYFHGDDFDPGGRGDRSRAILDAHNIDNLVIDQPPQLTTHWAASTGLFVRRFAGCIRDFIDAPEASPVTCNSSWGESPSQQIAFAAHLPVTAATATPPLRGEGARLAGKWYGYYGNGRETMFTIEHIEGDEVTAIYSVGPGITADQPAEWVRRTGKIVGNTIEFSEAGKPTLGYRLLSGGKLQATWRSADGKERLETTLRRTTVAGAPTTTAAGAQ